jgi:hypothetical protein
VRRGRLGVVGGFEAAGDLLDGQLGEIKKCLD